LYQLAAFKYNEMIEHLPHDVTNRGLLPPVLDTGYHFRQHQEQISDCLYPCYGTALDRAFEEFAGGLLELDADAGAHYIIATQSLHETQIQLRAEMPFDLRNAP
jgi:hypothetical protein